MDRITWMLATLSDEMSRTTNNQRLLRKLSNRMKAAGMFVTLHRLHDGPVVPVPGDPTRSMRLSKNSPQSDVDQLPFRSTTPHPLG